MSKIYSTPGVYIEEKNALPNSVVAVATAVPAFIGHTEKAIFNKKDVTHEPVRISSFGEYLLYFGGAPKTTYSISKSSGGTDFTLDVSEGNYLLYNSIKLFYANGGADCYIVSVGSYREDVEKDNFFGFDANNQPKGIDALKKYLEPTMVVIPEAVLLDEGDCHAVQQQMLMHCGNDMRSRVAILDVYDGYKPRDMSNEDVVTKFREGVGQEFLDFGTAYYPWLDTTITSRNEVSFENINMDSFDELISILKTDTKMNISAGLLDAGRGKEIDTEVDKITTFKPFTFLEKFETALGAMSDAEIAQLESVDLSKISDADEKKAIAARIKPLSDKLDAALKAIEDLTKAQNDIVKTLSAAPLENERQAYKDFDTKFEALQKIVKDGKGEKYPNLTKAFDETKESLEKALEFKPSVKTLNQALGVVHPLYKSIIDSITKKINLLPPAAAMAGIYTMVDNNVGVFQAPANVSVGSVVKPAINISGDEQDDLNVPLNGKAVNAIRTFPGKGTLVWGARTLDGNSMDWRYISVKRTVIMIEQSVKNAAEAYVFETNTAATWENVKAMLKNFLTNVWAQGALAGATPEDAFSVDIGLGTTMTPADVLEGIMKITVKIAVTRPAEFIVLTFEQQMQKS